MTEKLHVLEQSIRKNMDVLGEYLNCHEQIIGSNMNIKSVDEGSDGNVIGKWEEEDPSYVVVECLAELCPEVIWKAKLRNN